MAVAEAQNTRVALRVLSVQGSPARAAELGSALGAQGYVAELDSVQTREELQRALARSAHDVLLCDYAAALDGFAVLRAVQAHGADLPFVVVCDEADEASAIELMRAGAHDVLLHSKLARLGAVVERELREAAIRAERRRLQQQLLLADRLSTVGTLAASVAHEINNPLSYVLGNIEFALARLGPGRVADEDVLQALSHAREGSERLRATTRDLKVFCRTDDDARGAVNVRKVLESAINMAYNEIRHRGRLRKELEAVPAIEGNENRLGQVFLNLLLNAAQALPDGQVDESEIVVSVHSEQYQVVVEISDNGCGISEESMQHLFEPFYTTKPVGVGSGIGLSICRSIVQELGGQIDVESSPGQGASFRVSLPALEASYGSRPPGAGPLATRRARVLVVDDEPALCTVIKRLLGGEHEVHTFLDAGEALSMLQRDDAFDVVFCDLMMPRMSGAGFYEKLGAVAPRLQARTVFLTGGVLSGPARQFLSSVESRVIEKPFTSRALEESIARLQETCPNSGTWLTSEALGERRRAR